VVGLYVYLGHGTVSSYVSFFVWYSCYPVLGSDFVSTIPVLQLFCLYFGIWMIFNSLQFGQYKPWSLMIIWDLWRLTKVPLLSSTSEKKKGVQGDTLGTILMFCGSGASDAHWTNSLYPIQPTKSSAGQLRPSQLDWKVQAWLTPTTGLTLNYFTTSFNQLRL